MQAIIRNILLSTLFSLLTACSNDFLNENLTSETFPVGASNIYISPDWESFDCMFKLPSLKDADYEIVSKPVWLTVDSVAGHLSDSVAVIRCSAIKQSDFSKVGIYTDFITVKAEGELYKVPVNYITEGNPVIQVDNPVALSYSSYGYPYLYIQNTGSGVLVWNIVSMPEWLEIDTARIQFSGLYIFQYNSYNIPLVIKPGDNATGNLTGTIVMTTNDKAHPRVTINVSADLGTPQLSINSNAINFGAVETTKSLSFSNYGSGVLIWKFEDIPDWLTITPSNGMYNPYTSYNNISFSCDRTKLSPGQNTAYVNLKSNDSSRPSHIITITAVAPGSNENIRAVEGNIIDAVFNKNANTLYYVTSAPNKFIVYDVTAKAILHEIPLSKAPNCFAISEDWTKAAVGHNGDLSAIDLSGNTVKAVYTLNYSVHDLSWAENDWFAYTQKGGSFSSLHWINISTGASYDDTDKYSLDGSSIIKKVPGQPYLIATRNSTSPSGFFSYDISTKAKRSYSHMDLTNFWLSEDGQYVYARNSNIYRTSSSTGSADTFDADINEIGKINFGSGNNYGVNFIYHSNNYLWIIQKDSYSSNATSSVYMFEDNDYTMVKRISYDLLYQPDTQTAAFDVSANFVFANKEVSEIYVLSKGTNNNNWIIQFIPAK